MISKDFLDTTVLFISETELFLIFLLFDIFTAIKCHSLNFYLSFIMIYTFKYIRFQKFVNSILYLFKINFILIPLYIPRKQSMLFLKHASMLTGHIYLSRKAGTRKWLGAS